MILQLLQVASFMKLFQQPVRLAPVDTLDEAEHELREELSQEEHEEFFDDSFFYSDDQDSLIVRQAKALDGLCDRLYVLLGDAHTLGLGLLLPVAFRRVHESNMSKLWTRQELTANNNHGLQFVQVIDTDDYNVRAYVARNSSGKVIKSPSYQPANLDDVIDELHGQEILDFNHVEKIIYGDAPPPDIEELLQEFGKDSEDEID